MIILTNTLAIERRKGNAIALFTLFCIGTLMNISAFAQSPDWQHSTNWTLYNVQGTKFYKVRIDSLAAFSRYPLNIDSMHSFLQHVAPLPLNKSPLWMGAYITTCSLDRKIRKIDISTYGGFLYDETEGKFYEMPETIQKDWLNYLAGCAGAATNANRKL